MKNSIDHVDQGPSVELTAFQVAPAVLEEGFTYYETTDELKGLLRPHLSGVVHGGLVVVALDVDEEGHAFVYLQPGQLGDDPSTSLGDAMHHLQRAASVMQAGEQL